MVIGSFVSVSPARRIESGLLVVLGVLLLSQTGFAESSPDITRYIDSKDSMRRLEKGDLIVFKGADFKEIFGEDLVNDGQGSLVLFLVSKPPAATWNLLTDFDEHRNFMPHITESKVQWSDGNNFCIRYLYERLWTESTNYLIARCYDDAMTIVWHADMARSDKRFDGMNGFWRIQRYDENRTLVAIFRNVKHSGGVRSMAQRLLVSPRSGAKAVRSHIDSYNRQAD